MYDASMLTMDRDSIVGKARTVFEVHVIFDDADEPQVLVHGVATAATCVDAAKAYAMGEDLVDAIRTFGVREMHPVTGKLVPTAQEVLLRRMLNGGGMSVRVGNVLVNGRFLGYVPAR